MMSPSVIRNPQSAIVNILLVDDRPENLLALESILGDLGHRLVTAQSGREALRHLLEEDFAVILLDIQMPDMDGFETAELIRQRERSQHTPIIFVTATHQTEEYLFRGYEVGAVDYLIKPVVPEILRSKVAVFVDLFRQTQELARSEAELRHLNESLEQQVAERTAELRARNEEIATMSQQLWQTAKLATMGELAASIAHELNNPLATVTLRVESLLEDAPAGDPNRRALEVVTQEVERMATLVANLLQFSRRSHPQISTVDVREEVENTLELVHYHLRKRNVRVVKEFAPDVPRIQADRQQLRQLFLNLFTNASDAMEETKGGTLTLRVGVGECGSMGVKEYGCEGETETPTHPHTHTPTQILIEVADTGPGIAPEHLDKIMEPFFTTKPEGKGTGLGMAICKRVVQEHHGTLAVESEVGQGTTVRIALPAANGGNGRFLENEGGD